MSDFLLVMVMRFFKLNVVLPAPGENRMFSHPRTSDTLMTAEKLLEKIARNSMC